MEIKPAELEKHGYSPFEELKHDDLIPFVQRAIKFRTAYSYFYHALFILFFFLTLSFYIYLIWNNSLSWNKGLGAIMLGVALPFLTIPLHEVIHMLAYKIVGAPKTTMYANIRKFYFAALADQFVVNRQEFVRIALAPFIVLFLLFSAPLFLNNPFIQLTFLSALFIHIATCSGDFALLNYFAHHVDKELITYDDARKKITYFY